MEPTARTVCVRVRWVCRTPGFVPQTPALSFSDLPVSLSFLFLADLLLPYLFPSFLILGWFCLGNFFFLEEQLHIESLRH